MLTRNNNTYILIDVTGESDATILLLAKLSFIYQWVVYTVVCQLICIFGIGTNIINIICFIKQGFQDPVNVSFLGMAISDLASLTTLMWSNVSLNPSFMNADLPFIPMETQYLISGMPHVTFSCITAWITALVTLERCLCITLPLKVKSIITSRRMAAVVVAVFVCIMSDQVPIYVVNKLGLKYVPHKNKTLLGLIYLKHRESVEAISYIIINTFLPFCAFSVITVCTITLAVQLHQKTKWRQHTTSGEQTDVVSIRNQKVTKMVVIISTIFISCFVPNCIAFAIMSLYPEFQMNGKYKYGTLLLGGVGIVLESINSSVNIFVYYHMSSKYKAVFQAFFCKELLAKCNIV